MLLLAAALLAPLAGPALYRILHPRPRATRIVDGFVYVVVPVLVAWHVVPHAWDEQSIVPLLLAGAGFLLPLVVERASHALEHRVDDLAIVVWVAGIGLHSLLEGAALAGVEVGGAFAAAVIAHRIPEGLVLWWLVRVRHGIPWAVCGIAVILGSTLLGYFGGSGLIASMGEHPVEMLQAFVGGSLLHVVFHQGRHDHQH